MSGPARYQLVIWDCDGCVIDSEHLSCGLAARALSARGYSITTDQFVHRFAGSTWPTIKKTIETEVGASFLDGVSWTDVLTDLYAVFETELAPMPYVREAIESIGLPVCIASGSEPERLRVSLRVTGLTDLFGAHVYSAHNVARGKPAPDIFLYAAERMGVRPQDCLVIEDSPHGIHGAMAAGMDVFAFVGGSHVSPAWKERIVQTGVPVLFDSLRDLPRLVTPNSE